MDVAWLPPKSTSTLQMRPSRLRLRVSPAAPPQIALLRETAQLGRSPAPSPLTQDAHLSIKALIQHRFRRNVTCQSKALLQRAFTSGWRVLDALEDATTGSAAGAAYLSAMLAEPRTQSYLNRIRAEEAAPRAQKPSPRAPIFAHPDEGLRERPRKLEDLKPREGTGQARRTVPVLFSANKIPVLRLDKPQPPALSTYIESLIALRARRWLRVEDYEVLIETGAREDDWDEILHQGSNVQKRKGSWSEAGLMARDEVMAALDRRDELSSQRAKWYIRIVDEETALKEKERKDRVMERNKKAFERKKVRYQAAGRD
ncbi:hypothetical protein ANO11243_015430 [Dothideomycetidae sp. 11243]|nr:hypothetical protein ANO11243_015430 [fungal sp. No.11243]